ncbi:MAG: undecaprenyl-diphosphate phosphatase [Roseimicrobium sp.]
MPDWLSVTLLGLIEGVTEFIPVSSTGHLLIAEKWLPITHQWSDGYKELFTVLIQSGAALALVPLFWDKFSGMMFRVLEAHNRALLGKLALAFGITCVGALAMKKMGWELPESATPVAWATLIGGIVILAVEQWGKKRETTDHISWTLAICFGLAQLIAMAFPGASRSGSTIMLALALGLARPAATEFSFLLGVPTLLAAGAFQVLDAYKDGSLWTMNWGHVALGFIASAVSAFIVVRWLIRFVQGHTFNGFAVYRILLGGVLLLWFTK